MEASVWVKGGSHLLKQRDELEQSGFQQRVCKRPDKSRRMHSICKPLQWGGGEEMSH